MSSPPKAGCVPKAGSVTSKMFPDIAGTGRSGTGSYPAVPKPVDEPATGVEVLQGKTVISKGDVPNQEIRYAYLEPRIVMS